MQTAGCQIQSLKFKGGNQDQRTTKGIRNSLSNPNFLCWAWYENFGMRTMFLSQSHRGIQQRRGGRSPPPPHCPPRSPSTFSPGTTRCHHWNKKENTLIFLASPTRGEPVPASTTIFTGEVAVRYNFFCGWVHRVEEFHNDVKRSLFFSGMRWSLVFTNTAQSLVGREEQVNSGLLKLTDVPFPN